MTKYAKQWCVCFSGCVPRREGHKGMKTIFVFTVCFVI